MRKGILASLLLMMLMVLTTSGCATAQATGVPWWKAIPCCALAPNSQEAEAWREHRHISHGCSLPYEPAPYGPHGEPTY